MAQVQDKKEPARVPYDVQALVVKNIVPVVFATRRLIVQPSYAPYAGLEVDEMHADYNADMSAIRKLRQTSNSFRTAVDMFMFSKTAQYIFECDYRSGSVTPVPGFAAGLDLHLRDKIKNVNLKLVVDLKANDVVNVGRIQGWMVRSLRPVMGFLSHIKSLFYYLRTVNFTIELHTRPDQTMMKDLVEKLKEYILLPMTGMKFNQVFVKEWSYSDFD